MLYRKHKEAMDEQATTTTVFQPPRLFRKRPTDRHIAQVDGKDLSYSPREQLDGAIAQTEGWCSLPTATPFDFFHDKIRYLREFW
jgi:hypothetical protein